MYINNTSSLSLLAFALSFVSVQADFCSLGWPAVLGSASRDGDTSVTIWSETPDKDYYLIGGNSDSQDFTEQASCSKGGGCAYLANWNRITQQFDQKWVFTDLSAVADIKFEPYDSPVGDKTFALVFAKKTKAKNSYQSVITFNTWSVSTATLSEEQQTVSAATYGKEQIAELSKLSLFETSDRFHMLSNDADGSTSTDVFFILNEEGEVDSIYADTFTSSTETAVSAPTMKVKQGFGYDSNNVI